MNESIEISAEDFWRLLQDLASESPYAFEAYQLVIASFYGHPSKPGVETHSSVADYCWHLHDVALKSYGTEARAALEKWGIRSTRDIGEIVYSLIHAELLQESDRDRIEDFDSVFDFADEFREMKDPRRFHEPFRFRLATLLGITTLLAVGTAAVTELGLMGAVFGLYAVWLIVIGASNLYLIVRNKSGRSLGGMLLAAFVLCLGLLFLFFVTVRL